MRQRRLAARARGHVRATFFFLLFFFLFIYLVHLSLARNCFFIIELPTLRLIDAAEINPRTWLICPSGVFEHSRVSDPAAERWTGRRAPCPNF